MYISLAWSSPGSAMDLHECIFSWTSSSPGSLGIDTNVYFLGLHLFRPGSLWTYTNVYFLSLHLRLRYQGFTLMYIILALYLVRGLTGILTNVCFIDLHLVLGSPVIYNVYFLASNWSGVSQGFTLMYIFLASIGRPPHKEIGGEL